ncbi:MAG: RpiB/LacA/LacB family sugar-phosphate isomerase [Candidatus Roizmanbacteria bacterium]|nr:RpiB/LacA/LacB family sugar-phosphate isomerase [Candidatus Roizmanbacteria bacterium]
MKVFIAADHRGFQLKEQLKEWLAKKGYDVIDSGNTVYEPLDDYPDFASKAAKGVQKNPEADRGIVICGSGIGVDIVANKFSGVRSSIGLNADHVKHGRENDNINILALPAEHVSLQDAQAMVEALLQTSFKQEEKYIRRQKKIEKIENDR